MQMPLKNIWVTLIALMCTVQLSSQQTSPRTSYSFVVWLYDGGKISLSLEDHPVVTYNNGNIIVTTLWEQLTYPNSSISKFTLTDKDVWEGEETLIAVDECIKWQHDGNTMFFSDCEPGESVMIYNAAGQLITQYTISSTGILLIPLQQFTDGLYVVKTQSITYKFIKK